MQQHLSAINSGELARTLEPEGLSRIMIRERAPIPGYVKLPPSTVGFGGPLVSFPKSQMVFCLG